MIGWLARAEPEVVVEEVAELILTGRGRHRDAVTAARRILNQHGGQPIAVVGNRRSFGCRRKSTDFSRALCSQVTFPRSEKSS